MPLWSTSASAAAAAAVGAADATNAATSTPARCSRANVVRLFAAAMRLDDMPTPPPSSSPLSARQTTTAVAAGGSRPTRAAMARRARARAQARAVLTTALRALRELAEILVWSDRHDEATFDYIMTSRDFMALLERVVTDALAPAVAKTQALLCAALLLHSLVRRSSLYLLCSNNHVNRMIAIECHETTDAVTIDNDWIVVHDRHDALCNSHNTSSEDNGGYGSSSSNSNSSDADDMVAAYVSFLKSLALRLNAHTVHFFFVPTATAAASALPLVDKAVSFANARDAMVRTSARQVLICVAQLAQGGRVDHDSNDNDNDDDDDDAEVQTCRALRVFMRAALPDVCAVLARSLAQQLRRLDATLRTAAACARACDADVGRRHRCHGHNDNDNDDGVACTTAVAAAEAAVRCAVGDVVDDWLYVNDVLQLLHPYATTIAVDALTRQLLQPLAQRIAAALDTSRCDGDDDVDDDAVTTANEAAATATTADERPCRDDATSSSSAAVAAVVCGVPVHTLLVFLAMWLDHNECRALHDRLVMTALQPYASNNDSSSSSHRTTTTTLLDRVLQTSTCVDCRDAAVQLLLALLRHRRCSGHVDVTATAQPAPLLAVDVLLRRLCRCGRRGDDTAAHGDGRSSSDVCDTHVSCRDFVQSTLTAAAVSYAHDRSDDDKDTNDDDDDDAAMRGDATTSEHTCDAVAYARRLLTALYHMLATTSSCGSLASLHACLLALQRLVACCLSPPCDGNNNSRVAAYGDALMTRLARLAQQRVWRYAASTTSSASPCHDDDDDDGDVCARVFVQLQQLLPAWECTRRALSPSSAEATTHAAQRRPQQQQLQLQLPCMTSHVTPLTQRAVRNDNNSDNNDDEEALAAVLYGSWLLVGCHVVHALAPPLSTAAADDDDSDTNDDAASSSHALALSLLAMPSSPPPLPSASSTTTATPSCTHTTAMTSDVPLCAYDCKLVAALVDDVEAWPVVASGTRLRLRVTQTTLTLLARDDDDDDDSGSSGRDCSGNTCRDYDVCFVFDLLHVAMSVHPQQTRNVVLVYSTRRAHAVLHLGVCHRDDDDAAAAAVVRDVRGARAIERDMLDAQQLNAIVTRGVSDGVHMVLLLDEDDTVLCMATSPHHHDDDDAAMTREVNVGSATAAADASMAAVTSSGRCNTRGNNDDDDDNENNDNGDDERVVSAHMVAAVSNLWRAYAHADLCVNKLTLAPEAHALEQVLVDLGTAASPMRLCALAVADRAVLCVVSRGTRALSMGMLKLKAAALQRDVDRLLRPVMAALS